MNIFINIKSHKWQPRIRELAVQKYVYSLKSYLEVAKHVAKSEYDYIHLNNPCLPWFHT